MARNEYKSSNVSQYANIVKTKNIENRAGANATVDDLLLSAFLNNPTITRDIALNIPSLNAGIGFIADMVSITPLKLYKESNGKVEEIKEDVRVRLFNDDTGDTLNSLQMWRALIQDYFLGRGGFAYLNKVRGQLTSVHYVDQKFISYTANTDPIFKDYDIYVNGQKYKPFDFFKILRNTKDGYRGISLLEESPYLMSVCWNLLLFENALAKRGGIKDCFLESDHELTQEVIDTIQDAWQEQFSSVDRPSAIVLNEGIKRVDAGTSSTEMQLNENKITNSSEICKLLRISEKVLSGNATNDDFRNSITTGVLPVLIAIQASINKDVLLEKEKSSMYWAFDTTELMKADIKSRYEAYGLGIDKGFLKIDEVRYMEDKEPFGIDWINVGLNSVLYDTKSKTIYTPNTNALNKVNNNLKMGGE